MSVEIAIIAALEREVRPLVRRWPRQELFSGSASFPAFVQEGALVVCSGIGGQLARQAAVTVFAAHRPRVLISAGLAGALDSNLRVGDIIQPATVVDMRTGVPFNTCGGSGVLVSATSVLDRDAKRHIMGSYAAAAADMEAAAVALVAEQHGCPLIALKAISDEVEFAMPSFERFIDARGRIRIARLILSSSMRPRQWSALVRLGLNSSRASRELCRALAHLIEKQGTALEPALSGKRS